MPAAARGLWRRRRAYRRYQAELAPRRPPPHRGAGPLPDLHPLLLKARALTGQDAALITIEHPGNARSIVRIVGRKPLASDARAC